MKASYLHALEEEYKKAGQKPITCSVGQTNLIVPFAYKDKVGAFIDDLLVFQDNYWKKYEQAGLEPKELNIKGIHAIPPLEHVQKGLSEEQKISRYLKTLDRFYASAIKKTLRARKEYPQSKFEISLNPIYLKKLDELHGRYCVKKTINAFAKVSKFTASQTTQMIAGAAGIIPAKIYQFLDKKYHFASTRTQKFINEKAVPYIQKGALKALIPLSVWAAVKFSSPSNETTPNAPQEIVVVDNNPQFGDGTRYSITDEASFKNLYQQAFPLIAGSMLPTEILVCNPYSDNGKPVSNTIGLGSYWFPQNGNPQSSTWIKTSQYVKTHSNVRVSGQEAYALADGWFCHRENGRIYKEMYKRLEGAQLTVNEFAAIANCIYNDEKNGKILCDSVCKNWQDPVKCASYLMNLKPGNSSFNDGILKRHTHEALMYLDVNDYVFNIPHLLVKEGVNSKGNKYYVSSITQLSVEPCQEMLDELASGQVGPKTQNVARKIINYRCKDGKTLQTIAMENGIGDLKQQISASMMFSSGPVIDIESFNQHSVLAEKHAQMGDSLYNIALTHYKEGNFQEALQGFQNMVSQGFDGADIHNDMAITYYKQGKYQECINECRAVLATGESEQFAAANFNAGMAYEKLGNNAKALENYNLSLKYEPEVKAYQNAVNRLSPKTNQTKTKTKTGTPKSR